MITAGPDISWRDLFLALSETNMTIALYDENLSLLAEGTVASWVDEPEGFTLNAHPWDQLWLPEDIHLLVLGSR